MNKTEFLKIIIELTIIILLALLISNFIIKLENKPNNYEKTCLNCIENQSIDNKDINNYNNTKKPENTCKTSEYHENLINKDPIEYYTGERWKEYVEFCMKNEQCKCKYLEY